MRVNSLVNILVNISKHDSRKQYQPCGFAETKVSKHFGKHAMFTTPLYRGSKQVNISPRLNVFYLWSGLWI
jgi:hypothetical protein